MIHVLIIEDDVIAAADIQEILKPQGATSFAIAETEREAVSAARDHRPDIITSDVRLAEGTGPGAVRQIRAELGALPVIFITGTPKQCDESGGDAVLEKPFNALRLEALFRSAIHGAG